jgi:hypothetical protein
MDPDRVTPVHLVALANWQEAWEALVAVSDEAALQIASQWNDPVGEPYVDSQERSFEYPAPRRDQSTVPDFGAWGLMWSRFGDSNVYLTDGRPAVPCFLAGANAQGGGALGQVTAERLESAERAGFRILKRGSGIRSENEYIVRVAYPDDIIAGPTLEEQARVLARWVVEAFSDLSRILG